MKQFGTLAIISAALVLSAVQSNAQTQDVQTVMINLTGVEQGSSGTTPVKITNKEILTALGGTGSNGVFTTKAKLVAITPLDGSSPTGIFVRDIVNGQTVDTDVSANFNNSTIASVSSGSGKGAKETSVQTFSFSSDTLSYDTQGYTTGNTTNLSENSQVNGSASVDGNTAIVKGTITLGPAKAE
jgi:hypothetical protein